jgi:hypothetical protein
MKYATILALGLAAATAACELFDKALGVQNPSNIPASSLETPGNAQLLVNGAIADFECAAGSYAVMGGLITDELLDATQTADRFPYDRRTMTSSDARYGVNDCIGLGVYTPLQTARFSALNVRSLLQGWTDAQVAGRDSLIAIAQAYEGYSLVLLGEGFCSTVVSTLDANRQVVFGGEIQPDSVFALAVAAFSAVLGTTSAGSDIHTMALVGRARAYADLAQLTPAKADAQLVAASYVKYVTASAIIPRRYNRIWQENSSTSTNTSLGPPYINMTDPRVQFAFRGDSSVTKVPLYEQLKYTAATSPIRLASGDEARLIIAEADLAAGDFAGADSIISNFRARGGQGTITSVNPDTVKAALIDQRDREFFLEGQHLGDVNRFGEALAPPAGTPYPGGGKYGTQVCLPLPDVEKNNNPNF